MTKQELLTKIDHLRDAIESDDLWAACHLARGLDDNMSTDETAAEFGCEIVSDGWTRRLVKKGCDVRSLPA